ncbi:MAG: type II CAAX endopeptidase family protein [Candidatus Shapirobacteria bacterium]|nr:type II CAAX endopeptidase family protein [Candidatus Shapirobacteria bacterium]
MKIFNRFFHHQKLSIKHVLALFSIIFVFWSFYRYLPQVLPLWAEELILKPLFWLIPTFWLVRKIEKQPFSSLGFNSQKLFPSIYWGIGLGLVFAFEGLLTNIFKYKGLNLISFDYSPFKFLGLFVLSLITAFSEETVFRGYIFNRLWRIWKNEWVANLVSSVLFTLIHLPIGLFVLNYNLLVMSAYLFFVFIFAFGSAFVFGRTKNIIASILLHLFWAWPIVLFR